MKNTRVLFLTTNVTGVNFWRMYQYYKTMKNKGIETVIYKYDQKQSLSVGDWEMEFETNYKIRDEVLKLMQYSDMIIFQYIHIPEMLALLMMFLGERKLYKPILCEIDDYVIDTPDYNPAFIGGWKPGCMNEKCIIEQMKISNGIIASTGYLGNLYRKYNPHVDIIPNSIDFKLWNVINKNKKNTSVRIGWIGGGNHEEDLRIMEQVIPEVLKARPETEFYFAHGVPSYLKEMSKKYKQIKFDSKWVDIEKYPKHLASLGFDIGLAPLVDNKFNRGKSNLRWLEYSAMKIPSVCTNIEPYAKSILHGHNGYLCQNAKEWISSILNLIDNKELRVSVGQKSYKTIKKDYNLDKVTDKYIDILKGYKNDTSRIGIGDSQIGKRYVDGQFSTEMV